VLTSTWIGVARPAPPAWPAGLGVGHGRKPAPRPGHRTREFFHHAWAAARLRLPCTCHEQAIGGQAPADGRPIPPLPPVTQGGFMAVATAAEAVRVQDHRSPAAQQAAAAVADAEA